MPLPVSPPVLASEFVGMSMPPTDDHLLPRAVPHGLGRGVGLFVVAVLVGMVVAAALGGVDWLIGVGGAGTALGTLGLAYFTFAVAERTTELVGSSQRLENAAAGELAAGREQAREAQKTRIDALAPIIDFRVEFREGWVRPIGVTPAEPIMLSTVPRQRGDLSALSLWARLNLTFQNLGRTPAFATMKYVGAAFNGQQDVIRVNPGENKTFIADIEYSGKPYDPFDARGIRYEIEVRGAITGSPIDRIDWRGEITLLSRDIPGWHLNEAALRVTHYEITRRYADEEG